MDIYKFQREHNTLAKNISVFVWLIFIQKSSSLLKKIVIVMMSVAI